MRMQRWRTRAIAVLMAASSWATPARAEESALDIGVVVRDLQTCTRARLQEATATTLESLQAISIECLYRTLVLDGDGRIRDDASERLSALVAATGLQLPAAQGRGSASVPVRVLENSNLLALEVVLKGRPLNFLLDTGASNTLLGDAAREQLGLSGILVPQQLLSYLVVGDDCERLGAKILNLPPASVEGARVSGITGISLARSPVFEGTGADGVLGLDFLRSFDVTLDPAARKLQLSPRSSLDPTAIELEGRLGVMTTMVEINGSGPYRFLLDTGASRSVITSEVAREAATGHGTPIEVQGFCGPERGRQVRLNRLSIDGIAATDLEAVILDSEVLELLGIDGIVGQNYLGRFEQIWRFGPPNALGFPDRGSLKLAPVQ